MALRTLLLLVLFPFMAVAAPVRICIVGDSISAGFSPSTHGWGTSLKTLIAQDPAQPQDFGVLSIAHSGDKIANAQAVYDLALAGRTRPTAAQYDGCNRVAFLIGTNDLVDGTSAATMWAGTKTMVDAARAAGANVLLLALLPRGTGASWSTDLGTRLLAYNALQSAYANASTIVYVDTYTALLEPASSPPALAIASGGATDGLHPNNAGQLLIAQTVQAAVVAAGGW